MNSYDVSHDDALAVLRPSGPTIDSIVGLMARLVAQQEAEVLPTGETPPQEQAVELPEARVSLREQATEDETVYWLTPVRSDNIQTAEEVIQQLIGTEGIYAFSERTPGRKRLKPGIG